MVYLDVDRVRELALRSVDVAKSKEIDADFVFGLSSSFSVEFSDGDVESWESSVEQGVGIRVVRGDKQGFAYTNSFEWDAVIQTLEDAVLLSDVVDLDPYNSLAKQPEGIVELQMVDTRLLEIDVSEKVGIARGIEESARKYDKRIVHTRKASYSDSYSFSLIANTNGLFVENESTSVGVGVGVIAQGDKDMATGYYGNSAVFLDDLPEEVGMVAARRAVEMLDAKSVRSGTISVVFDPVSAVDLLSVLAPLFSAEEGQKGRSVLWDKKGEALFSSKITIIDDGTLPRRLGSSPTDAEGVKTSRKVLVKDGVLNGYLYNIYTANKDGVRSTGNGVRSYATLPGVGISNLFVEGKDGGLHDAIAGVKRGILVYEILGMHTVNPVSGEFSVGVSGLWIEDGEISYPVRGVTISDNILDMMRKVDFVGKDTTFFGNIGGATLRVRDIVLGGD